jgi:hypothetical protein
MLVGLISDTHDNLPMIRKALQRFKWVGCDCIIHAGDFVAPFALAELLKCGVPVYAVFGNNDGEHKGLKAKLPDLVAGARRITLCEQRITIVHDETQLTKRQRESSDFIIAGHTHVPELRKGPPVVINPGECGGWLKGKCTVATLEVETCDVRFIELRKRS